MKRSCHAVESTQKFQRRAGLCVTAQYAALGAVRRRCTSLDTRLNAALSLLSSVFRPLATFIGKTLLTTTVRSRTKKPRLPESNAGAQRAQASGHSETEPKRAAAIRPSRKRVAQRDCFQSATDFSERVLQQLTLKKQGCSSRASTACSSAREGALATQQKTAPSSV
jgi:hypothetical protein